MRVSWQKHNGVEAQLFQPDQKTGQAIVFCPGFPGMGATLFEQRHAGALAAQGYDVYVIKHKGVKLADPTGPAFVNNSVRLYDGRKAGETHIGGGPATIDEWLDEPFHLLSAIHDDYSSLYVIGNSFGALSSLKALSDSDKSFPHVKSLLLYAGAQGVNEGRADDIMRLWRPEFIAHPMVTQKVSLNDPVEIQKTLGDFYKGLPGRVKNGLSPDIKLSYLVVANDELLTLKDTEDFRAAIGGRGDIVIDDVDHAWPDMGLIAHDTPNYKTDDLLALLAV
ncbi:MAG: hypothetical protein H6868_07355 [Rhodospirillales bacterium]|nr:hypothetical protein [Rhodospirillales bacterium]